MYSLEWSQLALFSAFYILGQEGWVLIVPSDGDNICALIEQNNPDMPLAWFYASYQKKYGNKRALEELPLPSNWLYPPTIFIFIWLIASVYVPGRIMFDNSFAVSSYRPAVFVISIIIGVFVLAVFCWLSCKTITSLKMFISKGNLK